MVKTFFATNVVPPLLELDDELLDEALVLLELDDVLVLLELDDVLVLLELDDVLVAPPMPLDDVLVAPPMPLLDDVLAAPPVPPVSVPLPLAEELPPLPLLAPPPHE